MTTIEEHLSFLAETGARLAAMTASRDPALARLGQMGAQDLLAWRAQHEAPELLARGRELLRAEAAARVERTKARMAQEGPGLWAEWHTRAARWEPSDAEEPERAWLQAFAGRLPCGECRAHFLELCGTYFASGFDAYFAKTCEIHNAVNRKLGKRLLTMEEARQHWGME